MFKIRSCFPIITYNNSIGVDNICRDKKYIEKCRDK